MKYSKHGLLLDLLQKSNKEAVSTSNLYKLQHLHERKELGSKIVSDPRYVYASDLVLLKKLRQLGLEHLFQNNFRQTENWDFFLSKMAYLDDLLERLDLDKKLFLEKSRLNHSTNIKRAKVCEEDQAANCGLWGKRK